MKHAEIDRKSEHRYRITVDGHTFDVALEADKGLEDCYLATITEVTKNPVKLESIYPAGKDPEDALMGAFKEILDIIEEDVKPIGNPFSN